MLISVKTNAEGIDMNEKRL